MKEDSPQNGNVTEEVAKTWLKQNKHLLPSMNQGTTMKGYETEKDKPLYLKSNLHKISNAVSLAVWINDSAAPNQANAELEKDSAISQIEALKSMVDKISQEGNAANDDLLRKIKDELEIRTEWYTEEFGPITRESREQSRRYWLEICGFENPRTAITSYQSVVLYEAKLSITQKRVVFATGGGNVTTQLDAARRLKKSQQAVSKALKLGMEKVAKTRELLGGKHKTSFIQMLHWADTQCLSAWGKAMLQETGKPPVKCRFCYKKME